MMTRTLAPKAVAAFGVLLIAGIAHAQYYYVPGSFTSAAGLGGDWSPSTSPLMTETAVGSKVFNLDFTLTGTTAGQGFAFKILNSPDNSPAWGDPEITPNDVPFDAAADPNMSIRLDRNTYSDGYYPTTNRVAILDDYTTWTAIGNFQTQLGSASDYNNTFAATAMHETTPGSGIYSLTTTIPTAGAYAWRAVKTGTYNGVGTNGRSNNASNLTFNTFENNQQVTFEMNTNIGAIRYLTDAVLAGDTNNNGVVEFEADFYPIRDHFLSSTNLRANGDLDGSGFVDIADFRQWKNAFNGPPALVQLALAQIQGVPEPSSLALIGLATAFLGGSRRRAG